MEHFLDKNYPELAGSHPVIRAVKKAREHGEKPFTRDELIDAYISRLGTIFRNPSGFLHLKQMLLSEYVTKPEEIPESYWRLQDKIMSGRSRLGDPKNASDEERKKIQRINAESALADQKISLEEWIDYMASPHSQNIPDNLKYYIFRNVIKLQEFNKDKKEFPKRSRGTVKRFPEINEEAIEYVAESLQKKYSGEKPEFEYDIDETEEKEFNDFLEKEDFAKLYTWANTVMNPIPERLLKITDGEWRKFNRGSAPEEIVSTLKNKGTGWCTVGLNTAKTQIEGGDFYIYYSNDDEGNAIIPRIAILKEGNAISEVRGVAPKQNLDPYIGEILKEKLEEFPDKEKFLKRERDMSMLSRLVEKKNQNEEFSKEELQFLYEQKEKIQGFGEKDDPRISELRNARDKIADYCKIYNCIPEQIVTDTNDITESTIVYIGEIKQEDFDIFNNRENPIVIEGEVNFKGETKITKIPENTTFNGRVDFGECPSILEIPKGSIFHKDASFIDDISLASISPDTIFSENAYFSRCPSLKEIPDNVIFTKDAIFNGCTSLSKIPKCTFEGDANFFGCTSLVEIPEGLIFNGTVYFNNCTSLTRIPEDTLFNGYADFSGCEALMDIPEDVIKNVGGSITLPEHLKEKYSHLPNVNLE